MIASRNVPTSSPVTVEEIPLQARSGSETARRTFPRSRRPGSIYTCSNGYPVVVREGGKVVALAIARHRSNPLTYPACALGREGTHRVVADFARRFCIASRAAARFGPTRPAVSPAEPRARALGIRIARAQIIPTLAPDTRLCKC
eukprot:scaffold88540_cov61-Phaeocystis_antarctica.AAC.5